MSEIEQTQIVTRAREIDLVTGDRVHCLELSIDGDIEKRHLVSPLGLKIGRTAPADIIIADSEVSRSHCMVILKDEEVYISDLNSTNGTYVDGVKVTEATVLPVGSVLQVGNRLLKHEWRTRAEIEQSDDFDRELQRAASYVKALLPAPLQDGPIRAEWVYEPSAKLGGDAFGYGKLSDDLFVCYLVDVAGHGAGAAMHAVAIMNQLRQKTLPNTDMAKPELVLSTLNELFQMDDHDGLYFTIWYGVYDAANRRLDFASGGHHPAYLVLPDRSSAIPLKTRNFIIGGMPAMDFTQGSVRVQPGSSLYVFSDGSYEIVDKHGTQWSIEDFVKLILDPPADGLSEPQRLYEAVCSEAQPSMLDDDFSLFVVNFD
ncbi:MAG: SpoIIE family protein phosphatase [Novosphingobium sp.]